MQLYTEKNSDGTKYLRLKGNELRFCISRVLKNNDIPNIIKYIIEFPTIIKLDLAYNEIGDDGFSILAYDFLRYPNNLKELNLMQNNLTERALEILCALGPSITLKSLRLNGNKIGVQGGKLLSLFLAANNTIEHLDIAETDQTLSSLAFLITMLREDRGYNHSVKVLDISRVIPCSKWYQYQTNHLAESIGNMLSFNSVLVELHMQKCQFNGHDIELMLIGLSKNRTLKFLDLGYNRIADMGIELLADYLKTKPNLLGLNVAGNMIGDNGARALSFGLPCSKIRLLDISHNKIEPSGIQDILNSIKKVYKLRFISMWGNKFDDTTNKIIYKLLKSKVLEQEYCDVTVYRDDKNYCVAHYPSDHWKHEYYCELNYGVPKPVKIIKNQIPVEKFKVEFLNYPKLPPI